MEASGYHHAPTPAPLGKGPCTNQKGDWMDDRASLEVVEKKNLLSLLGFEPRTILSAVQSLYRLLRFLQNISNIYSVEEIA